MATTISQAENGRKTVTCEITGLSFTRLGDSLDIYTVVSDSERTKAQDHELQRKAGLAACVECGEPLY